MIHHRLTPLGVRPLLLAMGLGSATAWGQETATSAGSAPQLSEAERARPISAALWAFV
jgi:hypothetical protein